jgi:glycosyltransferase involved in cell wall biosynthesis
LAEWKGSRDAVAALEIAKAQVPNLEAVMFGISARPPWVPQWIEYWRDPPQSVLVSDIYNGSAVYLCASWAEGWHLPPAEAMACGCALASTRIDGVADFAIDGRTALLAAPRDPEALAEQLVRLLRHSDLRVTLAQAGYEHIGEFDWEKSTSALERWFLENSANRISAEPGWPPDQA